jgi:uracil-DNA glycosylase family 4
MTNDLESLEREVVACRTCPRLVEWREQAAARPPARFAGQAYWARPLPGFGDPDAPVIILGLAPAADGGNRTGRIFTGDRSGDFLFASLHRTGFANQSTSVSRDDGLAVHGAWVTAVNRCAPPDNKPTSQERDACLPYLVRELGALRSTRVIVALGAYAWTGALLALARADHPIPKPRPTFGHGAEAVVGPVMLLGCFHPSPLNTNTRKLTEPMIDAMFERARALAFDQVAPSGGPSGGR